ncbi:MAG: hypothetical protein AAF208_00270 [Cyanobacteria bacterium P01_A01_bin.45]
MSKRFISLTAMLAVSTLNVASTLPAFGQEIDRNTPDNSTVEGLERPTNARIINTPLGKEPVPVTEINQSQVRVLKKAPIRFKSFEIKDPETGKIVALRFNPVVSEIAQNFGRSLLSLAQFVTRLCTFWVFGE